MKIAFMGSRGVPASYSGFETFVEQLGVRLAARGHQVYVYNRSTHVRHSEKTYRGMRVISLPTLPTKHLDTIIHTFFSILHGAFMGYDIVYICGVGSAVLSFLPRLFGARVLENVDGADWTRKKWGGFARWFLRVSERFATLFPNVVIADSVDVQTYYRTMYGKETVMIPYGADVFDPAGVDMLKSLGVEARNYLLFVGRLVPENNAHMIIDAFRTVQTGMKLVIVGDNPYDRDYVSSLRERAAPDPRIIFTGFVFGRGYHQLSANAYVFILAAEVGGTHPVLLEALAFGNCVVANNTGANMEVIGDAAIPFDGSGGVSALAPVLRRLAASPAEVESFREKARRRVREKYSWDVVTESYDRLFRSLAGS